MKESHLRNDELAALHRAGSIAADDFRRTLSELVEETTSADPLEFLARAVMMVTINGLDQSKPESKSNLQLFQVELIQALASSKSTPCPIQTLIIRRSGRTATVIKDVSNEMLPN